MNPMLKATGARRLKPKYDKQLSNFAFNFNLRRNIKTYYSKNMQQAQRFNVDNVTLGRAGGVFRTRTSTRPMLNRRTESARPSEHSP